MKRAGVFGWSHSQVGWTNGLKYLVGAAVEGLE